MMGVYIKGMVMPTSCTNCEIWADCSEVAWFFSSDYDYEDLLESELDDRRHSNCPLVEVPEPHGRLIDTDRLAADLEFDAMTFHEDHEMKLNAASWLRSNQCHTVIEAEGSE